MLMLAVRCICTRGDVWGDVRSVRCRRLRSKVVKSMARESSIYGHVFCWLSRGATVYAKGFGQRERRPEVRVRCVFCVHCLLLLRFLPFFVPLFWRFFWRFVEAPSARLV